jgi:hypothetical protein
MTPAPIRKVHLWLRANGVYISCAVIILAFGTILLMLANSQSKLAEQSEQNKQVLLQLKSVTEQIGKSATSRTDQINGIDRHLDCIVAFFAQPDRSQKLIADIETCRVQDNKTAKTLTPAITTPVTPSNQAPTATQAPTGNSTQHQPKQLMSHNTVLPAAPGIISRLGNFLNGLTSGL